MSCPSCGAVAIDGARFCSTCGQPLVTRSDERRVATVVFADLVGFTSLSESADPEQIKNLVDTCFELLVRDVTSFGGKVDKIVGDAIIALFGAPVAHEDDAERAVRAALRMQETLAAYRAEVAAEVPVQVRIGVNTGEVLVGALRAGGDYTAMGDVVNTAQRLQVAALPGGVVVGPSTYAATREVIAYRSLGPVGVKGRDEPVEAWVAIETLLPPGHRPRRSQTPFVGRETELGVLGHAIDATVERQRSHFVLLIGEAGVGKSRLAEETAAVARSRHGAVVFEGRCVPYGEANVWWPIAEALRQACEIAPDDALPVAGQLCTDAVAAALGQPVASQDVRRVADGLLYLMGFEVPLREIDPQRAREEATRAVLTFIEGTARANPVVVVLSDLHWADSLVLDMIAAITDRLSRQRVALIATARQSLTERWAVPTGRHNTVVVNLDPLERAATGELLDALVPGDIESEIRAALLDRSGGNPFFLEELVALIGDRDLAGAALASRNGAGALGDLPDTLRGLVAARIDGLTLGERGTLEDAAVWGRSGPVMALAKMAEALRGADEASIATILSGLADKEILRVEGGHWSFRSDLIREVAYGTLTKADRARRHHGIASYMSHVVSEKIDADERLVDVVAFHYGAAAELAAELGPVDGVPASVRDHALDWLEEAARRADVAQALPVAERLHSQALRLLGPEHSSRRVQLLLGRAGVLADMRDIDAARDDVDEAHELALELGDESGIARSLLVRGEVERDNGDLAMAIGTLADAVEHFRALGDDQGAADAIREIGMAQIFLGDNDDAEQSVRAALAASREAGDRRGEAWALQHLAWISFVEGRVDEAESRIARSAQTFSELGDLGGLGWATGLLAFVRFNQGNLEEARALGAQVLVEARQRGDRWGEGMMLLLSAGVALWSGHANEAVSSAREAHTVFKAIGDRFGQTQSLAALGRCLVTTGRVDDGLAMLSDAYDHGASTERGSDDRFTLAAALAGSAVAVGEPDVALVAIDRIMSEVSDSTGIGALERTVAQALALVQVARPAEAVVALRPSAEGTADVPPAAYAQSALALALATVGERDEVLALADEVECGGRSTYLDRLTAGIAAGLVLIRDGDEEGLARLSSLVETIDGTDDEVAKVVARMAEAAALATFDLPSATEAAHAVEARLRSLGISAPGWRTAIDLVLDPRTASV
ncbi:MAG: adenylate/guanylate cyclase domain-containing protein [Acidimicrobiales bacterium]